MQFKFPAVAAVIALALSAPLSPGACAQAPASSAVTDAASSAPVLAREDLEPWFDSLMRYGLGHADVAGAAVVVVKDGRVIFKKGYGYADMATRRPVDPDTTLFRPGSITKLFTWTAVMQEVEKGRIDLDRDINTYLDFTIPPFDGRPVTMRDLMTHSGGFEESYKGIYSTVDKGVIPLEQYIKRQVPARIYPPGQITAYSNFGVSLAGYILQRVSGSPYDDYVERNVLQPLGMLHSSIRQPPRAVLMPLMASGYDVASRPPKPYEVIGPALAGGLAATAADMANFMVMHLQDGLFDGHRLLEARTAATMHDTVRTTISPSLNRNLLGFLEMDRNGHRVIHHDGDSHWFHSQLMLLPGDNVGVFYSMNSLGRDGESMALRRQINEAFMDRYFPPAKAASASAVTSTGADHGRLLAGQYDSSRQELTTIWSLHYLTRQITVSADESGVVTVPEIVGANGLPERFREEAPFVWRAEGEQDRLAAKMVDGKVVMWSDDQDSAFNAFLPTPFHRNAVWLIPMLKLSLAIAALTAVWWPIARWRATRHGASRPHVSRIDGAARASVVVAGALIAAWFHVVDAMADHRDWSPGWVPWIMALHVLSIVAFPAAFGLAAWNVGAWFKQAGNGLASGSSWWSAALLVSSTTMLWIALTFRLVGLSSSY